MPWLRSDRHQFEHETSIQEVAPALTTPAMNKRTITYTEFYSGADGESHFRDIDVELPLVDIAPPAAPMNASDFRPAKEVGFITLPPGWSGGWHPAPSVGHIFVLSGEMEVEVSDGEIRRFAQGTTWLHRDLTGKGHDSRVVSKDGATLVMVKMDESVAANSPVAES
jgi:hypothetical protein